jgi:hypothetical protein
MIRKRQLYKVRTTNIETGRVDYHTNITRWDLDWLNSVVTLKVEVLLSERV